MADSNITKRALAQALRQLMAEIPFDKITISLICEKCGMNRKSFYYHFQDKYALLHWIFDSDFIQLCARKEYRDGYEFLLALCSYLYDDRIFYRRAVRIWGQNSFVMHMHEMLIPVVQDYLTPLLGPGPHSDFRVNFFTDGFVCAILRWITDRNCVEPAVLVAQLRSNISEAAEQVHRREHSP